MTDSASEIDGILHALGRMNVAWGHYEDCLFLLLSSVLGGLDAYADIALRNEIDLKTATAIIKSAALVHPKMIAREHILDLVAWTDRPLRESRNRFVHDPVYSGGAQFEQYQYVTRSKKAQSFKPDKVTVISARPITKALLEHFTEAIRNAEAYAGAINHHFSEEPEDYKPLSAVESAREALAVSLASYTALTRSLDYTK